MGQMGHHDAIAKGLQHNEAMGVNFKNNITLLEADSIQKVLESLKK